MKRNIEEVIRGLKAEGPEPLCAFLYDLAALKEHAARAVAALPPRARLFYAMKANPALPVLRALAPNVHGFEVASLGELRKVREVSPDAPVIFGGPGKTDAELEGALRLGVRLLHVESLHELRRLERIAARSGVRAPILLRVNLRAVDVTATLRMAGTPTQFGIDEADVPAAIALAGRSPHVDLQGFHFHSVSNNLDAESHVALVRGYVRRSREWARAHGLSPTYLNAGGGIGVNYADLSRQFDWATFARGLGAMLEEELPEGQTVLFECGRYVTAASGWYAAEVLDVKRNHGRSFAVIRGGTHHFRLPASWQHSHPFTVMPVEDWPAGLERPELRDEALTVVGQLCTPKDVLAREVRVERVRAGDILLFHYAGAYGWTISHHDFLSHPHPRHVFLDGE